MTPGYSARRRSTWWLPTHACLQIFEHGCDVPDCFPILFGRQRRTRDDSIEEQRSCFEITIPQ